MHPIGSVTRTLCVPSIHGVVNLGHAASAFQSLLTIPASGGGVFGGPPTSPKAPCTHIVGT